MAHLRRHSLPVPGRLPHHACGAYVGAAAAEELLHAEPVLGRAAVVFEQPQWGEGWEEGVEGEGVDAWERMRWLGGRWAVEWMEGVWVGKGCWSSGGGRL